MVERPDPEDRPSNGRPRNGRKLSIPLPFDEALRAAVETEPPEQTNRKPKPRRKKPAKR